MFFLAHRKQKIIIVSIVHINVNNVQLIDNTTTVDLGVLMVN